MLKSQIEEMSDSWKQKEKFFSETIKSLEKENEVLIQKLLKQSKGTLSSVYFNLTNDEKQYFTFPS